MRYLCIGILLLFFSFDVCAKLTVCNRTNSDVFFAYMMKNSSGIWAVRGWYKFVPNECGDLFKEDLKNRYIYYYARRSDGIQWGGVNTDTAASGCVKASGGFELDGEIDCEKQNAEKVLFKQADTGDKKHYQIHLTYSKETIDFDASNNIQKACSLLHSQLQRPKLRSQQINIGHYTDLLTLPQTKSECTNVVDTGIPDPSTCSTSYDSCASKLRLPLGGWTCMPGTTTSCTNVKVCDSYKNYKKTMECDIKLQLKLPKFIEQPITSLIDNSFNIIDSTKGKVAGALPLACVPSELREKASQDTSNVLAQAVALEVERRVRIVIEREIRNWLQETAITTIAAAIPSGGIGGGAAMGTSIAKFIYRAHKAVEPIIKISKEVNDFAEDLGFSTSCGWSDWHQW